LSDFDLDSFDIDVDLDNPFADEIKAEKTGPTPRAGLRPRRRPLLLP
jgi:hypothetical protein